MKTYDLNLTEAERAALLEFLRRTTLRPSEIGRYSAIQRKLIDTHPHATQEKPDEAQ